MGEKVSMPTHWSHGFNNCSKRYSTSAISVILFSAILTFFITPTSGYKLQKFEKYEKVIDPLVFSEYGPNDLEKYFPQFGGHLFDSMVPQGMEARSLNKQSLLPMRDAPYAILNSDRIGSIIKRRSTGGRLALVPERSIRTSDKKSLNCKNSVTNPWLRMLCSKRRLY